MIKITKILLMRCFLFFGALFSISANASPDYGLLSQQLKSEKTHIHAFEKLKQHAKQEPAALLPLLRFTCSDYATHNGGEDYKRIKAVISFLQGYGRENKVSEKIIESLFSIKKECYKEGSKRHNNLIYVLQEISSSQRFSDATLKKVLKLTSFQMKEDNKKRHNYSYSYFQILNHQTKFQHLPKKARYLAIQRITDKTAEDRLSYPPLDMLVGQLKYNDKKVEKILLAMIEPGNNPQLRRSVIDRLSQWYDKQSTLNDFTKKILALREQEKDQEMLMYYRKFLVRINKNKQITPDVSERIFKLATSKKDKYTAGVLLTQAYARKSETTELTENELKNVLNVLSGSNTIAAHDASKIILSLNAAGKVTKKLHESLIKLFFSPKNSPYQLRSFKKVILENIPYRNVENQYQFSKYPDSLLIDASEYARKKSAKISAQVVLSFMQEVYNHQQLPEKVVEGLYDIYVRQNQLSLQKSFSELFIRYYKETGYIRAGLLANGLYSNSFEHHIKIRDVIREELETEYGLKEGLYKMFSDKTLSQHTRKFFLNELANENLEYAANKILPPNDEEEKFQEVIWGIFYRISYNKPSMVDKKILSTATKSENYKIRHTAWNMLKGHGISTPFTVKWERDLYRMQVYSGILFFGGGPLSFILGSLLLLKTPRGRRVKYKWMNITRFVVWFLITVAGLVAGAGMIFIAGMSHSSVLSMQSHIALNKGFASIFLAYVFVALITRLFIRTVKGDGGIKK